MTRKWHLSDAVTQEKNNVMKIVSWLAQLVERQSAVREVEGSSPRPDQHSGS